eukprot:169897_1
MALDLEPNNEEYQNKYYQSFTKINAKSTDKQIGNTDNIHINNDGKQIKYEYDYSDDDDEEDNEEETENKQNVLHSDDVRNNENMMYYGPAPGEQYEYNQHFDDECLLSSFLTDQPNKNELSLKDFRIYKKIKKMGHQPQSALTHQIRYEYSSRPGLLEKLLLFENKYKKM